MEQYLNLLKDVLNNSCYKDDRTNTGVYSVFGRQMRFCDIQNKFPIVTTKKIHFKSIVHELLWFINGDTNIEYLNKNNVNIWNEWADKNGSLGPIYGKQWRKWKKYKKSITGLYYIEDKPVDQIKNAIDKIKNTPYSRRIIVSAWNVAELDDMALSPCHAFFQFNCRPMSFEQRVDYLAKGDDEKEAVKFLKNKHEEEVEKSMDSIDVPKFYLDCQLYQRSCDLFLGVPFNISSYALLTCMISKVTNTVPGDFVWTGGDVHIYKNHKDQVHKQLKREPYDLPKLKINDDIKDIDDFKYEDISLVDYNCHKPIKAPIAV